ncbi:MAG: hypothetical protein ACR2QW_10380 [bacterium]
MIQVEKHKGIAILMYLGVIAFSWFRDGREYAQGAAVVLGVLLSIILFDRLVIWFSSWGFMESFASDRGRGVPAGPAVFFFWILYVIAVLFILFKWSVY